MNMKTEAAWHRGNDNHAKANRMVHDNRIITDYERGARYAAYAICGMFALMIVWMWFAW